MSITCVPTSIAPEERYELNSTRQQYGGVAELKARATG
jgi:hypothetical protein